MNLTAETHSLLRDIRYRVPGVPEDSAIREALVAVGQRICDQVHLSFLILEAKTAEFDRSIRFPESPFPAIARAEYIAVDQRTYADALVRLGVIVDILAACK